MSAFDAVPSKWASAPASTVRRHFNRRGTSRMQGWSLLKTLSALAAAGFNARAYWLRMIVGRHDDRSGKQRNPWERRP